MEMLAKKVDKKVFEQTIAAIFTQKTASSGSKAEPV